MNAVGASLVAHAIRRATRVADHALRPALPVRHVHEILKDTLRALSSVAAKWVWGTYRQTGYR